MAVTAIKKLTSSGTSLTMRVDGKLNEVFVSLPAVYNIYNAAGAVAAIKAMGLPAREAMESLSSVHSSFGRLETFELNGNRLQMILVKNPAGCNQAFAYVTGLEDDYTAVLCLNNRTGDGHDYSWINDTDYERLCADPHLKKLYVGGECAQALYERLKTAGVNEETTEIITDYHKLVERLSQEKRPVFLLPNYTAMMDLRQVLSQATGTREFWE